MLLSWTKLSEDREKELNFGDRQSLWAQFKFHMEIGLRKAECKWNEELAYSRSEKQTDVNITMLSIGLTVGRYFVSVFFTWDKFWVSCHFFSGCHMWCLQFNSYNSSSIYVFIHKLLLCIPPHLIHYFINIVFCFTWSLQDMISQGNMDDTIRCESQ